MTKTTDALPMSPRDSAHPRQLSDGDAVFISVESPEAPSHIAGLTILDPSGCPEFGFDRFLEILHERIELVERFPVGGAVTVRTAERSLQCTVRHVQQHPNSFLVGLEVLN